MGINHDKICALQAQMQTDSFKCQIDEKLNTMPQASDIKL